MLEKLKKEAIRRHGAIERPPSKKQWVDCMEYHKDLNVFMLTYHVPNDKSSHAVAWDATDKSFWEAEG